MKNHIKTLNNINSRLPRIIVVIALLLVGVLTFNFVMYRPVAAKAARLMTYISDVKILTCSEATFNDESRKLKAEGYSIDRNYNFADQDEGDDMFADMNEERAYLAYKTTHDYRNAITDMAFMNMKGPYSFAKYEDLLDNQTALAKNMTEKLSLGLKLFRTNYDAKTPEALFAHKMLNYYREDDSGRLMGDFLLRVELNSKELTDVVLQISDLTLSLINCLIAVACSTVAGQDDWITKITNMTEKDLEDEKYNGESIIKGDILINTIQNSYSDFEQYNSYYKELKETFDGNYDEKDPDQVALHETITNDYYKDIRKLSNIQSLYEVLGAIPYSDSRFSFSPFGDFKGEHAGKGALVDVFLKCEDLDGTDLSGFASVFTEEQMAMIYLTGIDQIVTSASHSEQAWKNIEIEMNRIVKYDYENPNKPVPTVSVYMGVDRDLYAKSGIALTDEASRRQFIDVEDVWYNGNMSEGAEIALYVIAGLGAAMVFGAAAYTFADTGKLFVTYSKSTSSVTTAANKLKVQNGEVVEKIKIKPGAKPTVAPVRNASETGLRGTVRSIFRGDKGVCLANRVGGFVFAAGMFVLMLAVTIYFIVELILSFEKNYTTIPTMIVNNFTREEKVIDVVDGKDKLVSQMRSIYIKYTAVVNQDGEFADINKNGYEWIVPYVTKDPNAGDPILFDLKVMRQKASTPSGYSPMHRIGQEDLYNGHANSSDNPLYIAFKRDAKAYPKTGSAFSAGAFTLALCGGIMGGGLLGWLATWLIIKNKRKNKLVAAVTLQTSGNKK